MSPSPAITRFAPSPSGHLHLGHAYAAFVASETARRSDGTFLLRIDDIDRARSRTEFEEAIFEDLAWLGLTWQEEVPRSSGNMPKYRSALDGLSARGLLYPCFCTRADIRAEIERSDEAPHGPAGSVYPGICRGLTDDERRTRIEAGEPHALRLHMARALEIAGGELVWIDAEAGEVKADPAAHGDVVLARKDTPTSYPISVVIDDAAQGINLVTRGKDLFHATDVQRLLQELLGLPVPDYHHHRLVTDDVGNRLATRDSAHTLRQMRMDGATPESVMVQLRRSYEAR